MGVACAVHPTPNDDSPSAIKLPTHASLSRFKKTGRLRDRLHPRPFIDPVYRTSAEARV
jgi:hypothetical protein